MHLTLSVISCQMIRLLGICIHVLFGQPDRMAGEMVVYVGVGVGGVDNQ